VKKPVRNHDVRLDRVGPYHQTRVRCLSSKCDDAKLIHRVEWDQDEWSRQLSIFHRQHPCHKVKNEIPVN